MTTTAPARHVMRVRSGTNVVALGGAIAGQLRKGLVVEVHAIGPFAVNQAVKGIAAAAWMLADRDGHGLVCVPMFAEVDVDGGDDHTAMRFVVNAVDAETAQPHGSGLLLPPAAIGVVTPEPAADHVPVGSGDHRNGGEA